MKRMARWMVIAVVMVAIAGVVTQLAAEQNSSAKAGTKTIAAKGSASAAAPQQAMRAFWPQWRGPNRDAKSTETGLIKDWSKGAPALAWKMEGIGKGFSGVSVVSGKVFTMGDLGSDQYVFGLNEADGKILWKTKVGGAWDDEYPGPRGTPTVDGDRVYAVGTSGDVVCLEAGTGREVWKKNLVWDFGGRMMTQWRFAESPLVDGDRVLVTPGNNKAMIVALNKTTGQEIWRTEAPSLGMKGADGAGYASIVISNGAGVKQYVQLVGRGVIGVRASDGKFLWGYNRVANNVANVPTPIVSGDNVFASTGYQSGAALLKLTKDGDGVKAEEVYFLEPRVFQNHHGGMVLVDGYIYAGTGHNRGTPICIEMATGKVVWGGDVRNAGTGSAGVMYADGNLIFRYQNGVVMLIEATPSGYKEKGSFQIPTTIYAWPHPVIAGGKLYLREQDTLYVYKVKS